MRRMISAVFIIILLTSQLHAADQKKVGIGVVLGAPTGFSLKYWTSQSVAVQGAIGRGPGGLVVGADYLIHADAFTNRDFAFFYGPGAFVGGTWGGPTIGGNDVGFGVRGVFGVNYVVPNHPFEFALEIGPALLLLPTVGMGVEVGFAFRFYP